MGSVNYLNSLHFILVSFLLVCCLDLHTCNCRHGEPRKFSRLDSTSLSKKGGGVEPSTPQGSTVDSPIFNVLDYGAKGDGATNDTKAFQDAWVAACEVEGSTIVIPSGSEFLIDSISFSGHDCTSDITFELNGNITALTSSSDWGSSIQQWIEFSKLNGIKITGEGIIDGQGSTWWNDLPTDFAGGELEMMDYEIMKRSTRPAVRSFFPETVVLTVYIVTPYANSVMQAISFYRSTNVTVSGITIQNSPKFHLKFEHCTGVKVSGISISSPADSPNTDGIHLQNSKNAVISSVNIACGDDCISIQTGSSNLHIQDVDCGPGHGISIGSLGAENTWACVSNITVQEVKLHNTLSGVRIKTWQGGSGYVRGVTFSNIQVSEVKTPIIINQYYCDKRKCQNKTSAVAISGISYTNIKGTYTVRPVSFACSDPQPCKGISLSNIELEPTTVNNTEQPFCWKAYGEVKTPITPTIDCLQSCDPSSYKVQSMDDTF